MLARALVPVLLIGLGACEPAEPAPAPGTDGTEPGSALLPAAADWRTALTPELVALIDKHAGRAAANPADGDAHGTLGLVYRANGLWPEAAAAFARAEALAPEDPLWPGQRVDALEELGQTEAALELLEKACAHHADEPALLHRLTLARLEDGRFEPALELALRVVALAPEAAAAHVALGAARLELGQHAGAEADLRAALALDRSDRAAHYLLGRALRALGRTEEALDHLRRGAGGALGRLPDRADRRLARFAVGPEFQRQRATRAMASGRPDEALALLEPLAAQHPGDPRLWIDLGVAYSRSARPSEALEAFRRAGALDPRSHLVHGNLAATLLELGRPAEALEAAQRTVELAPQLAQGHLMAAFAQRALGKDLAARASLEQARSLAPEDRQVQRALAEFGPDGNADTQQEQP